MHLRLHLQPHTLQMQDQIGSAVKVEEGVYFIRGQFVRCAEQTLY